MVKYFLYSCLAHRLDDPISLLLQILHLLDVLLDPGIVILLLDGPSRALLLLLDPLDRSECFIVMNLLLLLQLFAELELELFYFMLL